MKWSLESFFAALNPILCAALSNQQLSGENESIFFENKAYVFDSSTVTLALGEVSNMVISVANDYYFNLLKIGYQPQQYDQKSGKYEYNLQTLLQAPRKNPVQTLDLTSGCRADTYGIETKRINIGDGNTTNYNGADDDNFIFNVDTTAQSADYDKASFISYPGGVGAGSGNQIYAPQFNGQSVNMPNLIGSYLQPFNNRSVFVINQPPSGTVPISITYSGNVASSLYAGESATIVLYINGLEAGTKIYYVTGAATPINDSISTSIILSIGDVIFVRVFTTANCTCTLNTATLNINSGYYTAQSAGDNIINPGAPGQLLVMPTGSGATVAGHSVVVSDIAAFYFNENLFYKSFTVLYEGAFYAIGTDSVNINLYLNGARVFQQTQACTPAPSAQAFSFVLGAREWQFGDIIFATVDCLTGGANAQIFSCDLTLTSQQILVYPLLRKTYDSIRGLPFPDSAYNIEELTPATMFATNLPFLMASMFNLTPDNMTFLTTTKNQYLSRTLNDTTITENANQFLDYNNKPLFYAYLIKISVSVPLTFAQNMNAGANGCISFTYNGKLVKIFPVEFTQKPVLNDAQEWTGLLCSDVDLSQFIDQNITGFNYLNLMPSDIFFSYLFPLQTLPFTPASVPQYHFFHMDDAPFIEQIQFWIFSNERNANYFQKWQINDAFAMQVITNGVTQVTATVYSCTGKQVAAINLIPVAGSPLLPPIMQLEAALDFTDLSIPAGTYYIVYATPDGSKCTITEGIALQNAWPLTLLFEYSNTQNKESMVFTTGYTGKFRVEGWISNYNPGSRFTTYEDEPADISLLGAVKWRTFQLNIAAGDGVPPWVIDKIDSIFTLCDTVLIDGHQYTKDADAQWKVKNSDYWPKGYWTLQIREAINKTGNTYSPAGLEESPTLLVNIDANAFGNNNDAAGPNIVQIEVTEP